MICIKRNEMDYEPSFDILTNEGMFSIWFADNLDLYWNCNLKKDENQKTFIITKENYYFYNLIDEIYQKIKHKNIENEEDSTDLQYKFQLETENEKEKLFVDNKVSWYSDDNLPDEAAQLQIELKDEEYLITFIKSKNDVNGSNLIRISNSGSRYEPFNVLFMQMYNKLKRYNEENRQIYLEEYLYELKRTRKKESLK